MCVLAPHGCVRLQLTGGGKQSKSCLQAKVWDLKVWNLMLTCLTSSSRPSKWKNTKAAGCKDSQALQHMITPENIPTDVSRCIKMIYSMLKAQQLSFPLIKAFSEEKMRLWVLLGCVQSKQNIKKKNQFNCSSACKWNRAGCTGRNLWGRNQDTNRSVRF